MVTRGKVTIPRRTLDNPRFPISAENRQAILQGRPTLPVETSRFPNTLSFQDTSFTQPIMQQNPDTLAKFQQTQKNASTIQPNAITTTVKPTMQQPTMQGPVDNFVAQDTANILGVNVANPNAQVATVGVQYQQMADDARARGDIAEANRLQQLANEQNVFTQFRNKNIDLYNQGINLFDANNAQYAGVMGAIDQDFKRMLQEGRNIFEQQYGAGGQQEQRIRDLNEGIGALSAKQAQEQQALAQAMATRTGATPAQSGAQLAQLQTQQLENQLKIQGQELQQYQELYNTYNNLLNNFIQQYAGSTDRNVVQTYRDILNLRNQAIQNLQEAQRQIVGMEMQRAMTPTGGGARTTQATGTEAILPTIELSNTSGAGQLAGVAQGLGFKTV